MRRLYAAARPGVTCPVPSQYAHFSARITHPSGPSTRVTLVPPTQPGTGQGTDVGRSSSSSGTGHLASRPASSLSKSGPTGPLKKQTAFVVSSGSGQIHPSSAPP